MIWQSPIYKFVIPFKGKYKEVFIDVTRSAPSLKETGKELQDTFDWALSQTKKHNPKVLDFGAGRLRNVPYLLKQGCTVATVEFEKLVNSDMTKKNIATAEKYGKKFQDLIFPHKFFSSTIKFDLIVFVNVLSVMPVPAERLLALKYCKEKLTEDGLILWYSQTTQSFYKDKFDDDHKLGDGYVPNDTDRYKSFYKDYDTSEIDQLFLSNGLRLHEKKAVPHVTARLYKSIGKNPLDPVLNEQIIRKYVEGDKDYEKPKKIKPNLLTSSKTKLNLPNPEELRDESLYIEALSKLPAGPSYPTEYHNLMGAILIKLFTPSLTNPRLEYDLNDGKKRVDIVMTNPMEHGFFAGLSKQFQIMAPYILIECKNYTSKIKNPELDQMNGRFKSRWGRFGIIVYRKDKDEQERKDLIKSCRNYLDNTEPNYILCLNDKHIIEMLNRKLSDESIDDYMQERMQELVLG